MALPASAGEVIHPHARRIDSRHAWRWFTRALTALPLLSLALLLGLASAYRPAPPATGDPLVDELRAALDARGSLPWNSAAGEYMASRLGAGWVKWLRDDRGRIAAVTANPLRQTSTTVAPNPVVTALAPRFDSDPRYRLLQYWSHSDVLVGQSAAHDLLQRGLEPRVWFLEESVRGGYADWLTHLYLLDVYYQAALARSGWFDNRAHTPRARVGDERIAALVDEMEERWASEPLALYAAATYAGQLAELDRAQALIERANSLPLVSLFPGWEVSLLTPHNSPLQMQAERAACFPHGGPEILHFEPWRNTVKQLATAAVDRRDAAALQELNTYACRFGQAAGVDFLQQLVGANLAGSVLGSLKSVEYDLNPGQQRLLDRQRDTRKKMTSVFEQVNQHSFQWSTTLSTYANSFWFTGSDSQQFTLTLGAALLSDWQTESVAHLRDSVTCHEKLQQFQQQLNPLWDELEQFDYAAVLE